MGTRTSQQGLESVVEGTPGSSGAEEIYLAVQNFMKLD